MGYTFKDAADREITVGARVIDQNTGQPGGTVLGLIEPEDHPARVHVKYDDGDVEYWGCSMIHPGPDCMDWRCDEVEIV